jgi:dTDP-4-dehydro-6-deoxy-alpha-D-glucopyranose 2,3-dehydratase
MIKLRSREDLELPQRLAASASQTDGAQLRMDEVSGWLHERALAHEFAVNRIPFAELRGWDFRPETGNLVHQSGRFFSVEGLRSAPRRHPSAAGAGDEPGAAVCQPIINQPEIGILGILVRQFDGVPHFLMQAKAEPGNSRPTMLSPTVQATQSNYTQVHGGAQVNYLEYFNGAARGAVIADVLQSEHGDWFYRKRNRNMLVEVSDPVPAHDDFCWLTLGQINELLRQDNVINMDARTVLCCLPQPDLDEQGRGPDDAFGWALAASRDPRRGAVATTAELLSWFTALRSEPNLDVTRVPLRALPGWQRDEMAISRCDDGFFRVVAVDVKADGREVGSWTQPMIEPRGPGLSAFLTREYDGVLHLLVRARAEGGFLDAVELGPTVQCMAESQFAEENPLLLAQIPSAASPRIRYEAVHSEEGGRFLNASGRYLIVQSDGRLPDAAPLGCAWMTVDQLTGLLRHSQYVNVQARTLIACLNSIR